MKIKAKVYNFLRWSERYTGTDMIYVAKGGFWLVLGKVGIFLISLATITAFANWLPKETFGAYRYIVSIIAILSIFSLPGMNTALVRAIAKGADKMLLICAKIKFKWALIGTGICLVISFWYFFHQNFILGTSLLIGALFLPFYTTFPIFTAFWHGKTRFDLQSKYLILLRLASVLVLIPIIFLTDNLILIILAYVASYVFFSAILFKITLKKVKCPLSNNALVEKETLSYGKHLTLMQVAGALGDNIDKVIIWQFLGPVPVAIYSFAQLPISRIHELIPIGHLAFPKLSEKNIKEIKEGLFKKFLKLFWISIPFALFSILIAPYIYKFLFPAYLESIPYFQVLALTLIFLPFGLLGTSLVTEMRKKELYLISYAIPVLQIILFLVLIPFYQIWGIIYAILISQIFGALLTLYFFKKI